LLDDWLSPSQRAALNHSTNIVAVLAFGRHCLRLGRMEGCPGFWIYGIWIGLCAALISGSVRKTSKAAPSAPLAHGDAFGASFVFTVARGL